MQIGIAQIKKLRSKSWREIRARGRQEISKLNERLFGFGTAEMTDTDLYREINPLYANGTGEGTSALILERIRASVSQHLQERLSPAFLPSFPHRHEIPSLILHRFPDEARSLIARANGAVAGRFNLLGFTELSFGDPIDWHLEPTSGKRTGLEHWSRVDYLDPGVAGDKKITWELNRHAHFVTLGQAYWLTNNERYAEAFVSQATSWMNANPPNRGINWASSLELAFRSIAWVWALYLLVDSPHLTPKFVTRFLKFLVAQGRHIESYLSHYFSPNTHLTGEALGLLYLGTALPELTRADEWQQIGLNILLEQLPIHIRRDGVYIEQSSYYHRYTVDFYIQLLVLARSQGWNLPTEVEQRLALALDHLMWLTRPDGTSPLIGDDDGGQLLKLSGRAPDDFRDTLATGAALFNRGDWKYVAGDAAVETLWLLGPSGLKHFDQIQPMLPTIPSRAFAESGYYVMRDGWRQDSNAVFIDCGPHGAYTCGHAHADALAFEFSSLGTTWLVDPGSYTYTSDATARNEFRETAAHNTAVVDGQSQSVPGGPFSWGHCATSTASEFITQENFDYFEGSHDGYKSLLDPVVHNRAIFILKPDPYCSRPAYLIVRDSFVAQGIHDYAINYHFSPSCTAITSDNQIRVSNRDGNSLSLIAFHQDNLKTLIRRGWVSRVYGRREPAPVGVIEMQGEGKQEIMSFILPYTAKHQGTRVERQQTGVANTGAFTVTGGDSFDVVIASNGINSVRCQRLRAIASMAWARFIGAELVRACMVQGKELEVSDALALRSRERIRHCVIQLNPDHLAISIEGTSRFDLQTVAPWQKVVVGEMSFRLEPNQLKVSFTRSDEGQWQLVDSRF